MYPLTVILGEDLERSLWNSYLKSTIVGYENYLEKLCSRVDFVEGTYIKFIFDSEYSRTMFLLKWS